MEKTGQERGFCPVVKKNQIFLIFLKIPIDFLEYIGYYKWAVARERLKIRNAGVAELADAQASGACGR